MTQHAAEYRMLEHRAAWLTVLAGGFNAFFAFMTFGSSLLMLYFMKLDLPMDKIGRLLSFFPFAGVIAVVLAPLTARFGYKRTFCLFYGVRKFVILAALATPVIMDRFGFDAGVAYVTVVILLFTLCRAIAETGYYPWSLTFVPSEVRGRYSAATSLVGSLGGLTALVIANQALRRSSELGDFTLLIGVGAVVGVVGVVLHAFVPGGEPMHRTVRVGMYVRKILAALGRREFRRFLLAVSLATISAAPMAFLPAYLKKTIAMPDQDIVLINMAMLVGGIAGSVFWGRVADRLGGRRTQMLGLVLGCVFPMFWLLLPRGDAGVYAAASLYVGVAIALSGGAIGVGTAVGSSKHLFGQLIPPRRRAEFSAAWYASIGLAGGAGPLIVGHLLVVLEQRPLAIADVSASPFAILFAATSLLQLAAAAILATGGGTKPVANSQ
ncbi:MAG: MFS transporter [Phycisphaerae bacterium]|nr:MFS transporter [Phycisphaerae bacterium]